jgi:hypothetical protein
MTRTPYEFRFMLQDGGQLAVSGRIAETLALLIQRGRKGVVAFDFPGGPAFRLAAYIHSLRKIGLIIETKRDAHAGGTHGRYVLHSPVTSFVMPEKGTANEYCY